ncbi:MAG: methyltransferase domain-containing protein [Acidobacteriia bacterium]|nr:methyltransferase domain-containing protein [Terriglobia bacterium]
MPWKVTRGAGAWISRLRLSGRAAEANYGSWWNAIASTREGAYALTYVVDDEEDYRTRGWYGDANSFGAKQLLEMGSVGRESRVLEIGCGMARIGREMAPHVREWHGADISKNMLHLARERTEGMDNVFLHELPDVSLGLFADESFDFVYATIVFMHLDKEDLFQYLVEARRVLKPDRFAYFDTWNLLHPDTYRQWRRTQESNIGSHKVRGRIQFATPVELRSYLEDVGFDVLRLDDDKLLRALCRRGPVRSHEPDDGRPPFGYIDVPRNGGTVRGELHVEGWALDDIERIEVFLDGSQRLGEAQLGRPRPDVAEAFPRYSRSASCGFVLDVGGTSPPSGRHTLQVVATDAHGAATDLAGNYRTFVFGT